MTDKQNKSETKPVYTPPKIEAIPKKWNWKEVGLDKFFLFAIASFTLGLNSFGETKHMMIAWQVNPNSDKIMGEEQYYFESNSKTMKKIYLDEFKDWNKNLEGTRVWVHMSTNQQEGLYIVKA